jgi:hypothetical protein
MERIEIVDNCAICGEKKLLTVRLVSLCMCQNCYEDMRDLYKGSE